MSDSMTVALRSISAEGMANPETRRLMELAYAAGIGAKAMTKETSKKTPTTGTAYRPRASDRRLRHLLDALKVVIGIRGSTMPMHPKAAYLSLEQRREAEGTGWFVLEHTLASDYSGGTPSWRYVRHEEVSAQAVKELMAAGMLVTAEGSKYLVPTMSGMELLQQGAAEPSDLRPRFGTGHVTLSGMGAASRLPAACIDRVLTSEYLDNSGRRYDRPRAYAMGEDSLSEAHWRCMTSVDLIVEQDTKADETDSGLLVVTRYVPTEKCRTLAARGWVDDKDDGKKPLLPAGWKPLSQKVLSASKERIARATRLQIIDMYPPDEDAEGSFTMR